MDYEPPDGSAVSIDTTLNDGFVADYLNVSSFEETVTLEMIPHSTVKPVFKGHLNIQEKVSLHDRCPFVTGSLTWGR